MKIIKNNNPTIGENGGEAEKEVTEPEKEKETDPEKEKETEPEKDE